MHIHWEINHFPSVFPKKLKKIKDFRHLGLPVQWSLQISKKTIMLCASLEKLMIPLSFPQKNKKKKKKISDTRAYLRSGACGSWLCLLKSLFFCFFGENWRKIAICLNIHCQSLVFWGSSWKVHCAQEVSCSMIVYDVLYCQK